MPQKIRIPLSTARKNPGGAVLFLGKEIDISWRDSPYEKSGRSLSPLLPFGKKIP